MTNKLQCPGQDQRFWKPEDIYMVRCPNCNNEIEFWKDDPYHTCADCQKIIRNPKLDVSCAKWCKHARECILGELIKEE